MMDDEDDGCGGNMDDSFGGIFLGSRLPNFSPFVVVVVVVGEGVAAEVICKSGKSISLCEFAVVAVVVVVVVAVVVGTKEAVSSHSGCINGGSNNDDDNNEDAFSVSLLPLLFSSKLI